MDGIGFLEVSKPLLKLKVQSRRCAPHLGRRRLHQARQGPFTQHVNYEVVAQVSSVHPSAAVAPGCVQAPELLEGGALLLSHDGFPSESERPAADAAGLVLVGTADAVLSMVGTRGVRTRARHRSVTLSCSTYGDSNVSVTRSSLRRVIALRSRCGNHSQVPSITPGAEPMTACTTPDELLPAMTYEHKRTSVSGMTCLGEAGVASAHTARGVTPGFCGGRVMSDHCPAPRRPATYVAVDVENLLIDGTARRRHERVQAVRRLWT